MTSYTLLGGTMDEEAAAAALAAVTCILEEEAAATTAPSATKGVDWHDTAKLVAQGRIPIRTPVRPVWSTIERLHRAGRGGSGIIGQ